MCVSHIVLKGVYDVTSCLVACSFYGGYCPRGHGPTGNGPREVCGPRVGMVQGGYGPRGG